jgi:hypothetical protein
MHGDICLKTKTKGKIAREGTQEDRPTFFSKVGVNIGKANCNSLAWGFRTEANRCVGNANMEERHNQPVTPDLGRVALPPTRLE